MAHSLLVRGGRLAWIAVLAGCGQGGLQNTADRPPLFREAAKEAGLAFEHFTGATGNFYLPEIMGSGVALLDCDLDGDLDVYLLQGAMLDEGADPAAARFPPEGPLGNRLFENRIVPDGKLAFVDATKGSGAGIEMYAMGVAVGDYDSDRDPDMYVTGIGPNYLLENNGDGTFRAADGPQDTRWSTSATFADYDGDGDLDLFFANFVDFSTPNNKECFASTGERDYCVPTVFNPVPDRLFRNDGGRFTDVTARSGLDSAFGNGLGVIAADLDADGRRDLYVANDTTENQMWINTGEGRFEDRAMRRGAAVNADGQVEAGMGVAAADFDNDGDDDLLMTHNVQETNTLYLNDGKGLFRDSTNRLGLGNSSLPFTGFGLAWSDFDHDGRLDVFVANGAVAVMESLRGSGFPFVQENLLYLGTEDGFEPLVGADAWSPVDAGASRGLATGDLDLDGDEDVVVTNCNGQARLYLNQSVAGASFRVRLAASGGNPFGLGARVGLCLEGRHCRWRRIRRDGSYLSSSEPAVSFASPGSGQAGHVEVHWPSGVRESFAVPPAGRTATLEEGAGLDRDPR